jgi:hypothetical protein
MAQTGTGKKQQHVDVETGRRSEEECDSTQSTLGADGTALPFRYAP